MPLSPEDRQHIATRTLADYEQHAQSCWEGTREHDVSQNIAAFLQSMLGLPPFDLLDFGCGGGPSSNSHDGPRHFGIPHLPEPLHAYSFHTVWARPRPEP